MSGSRSLDSEIHEEARRVAADVSYTVAARVTTLGSIK